ncbi:hypothetical protein [Desulforamulus reducens]|uniref:hypothetical protein n=1 Tax=Desulforamulus reducens TaxID=59610 RepID=UPI0012EAD156|nr:hypothetical protein [Desulforamulus reducens]
MFLYLTEQLLSSFFLLLLIGLSGLLRKITLITIFQQFILCKGNGCIDPGITLGLQTLG